MPEIFTFPQYSDSWWAARRGKVTASNMSRVMTCKTMKLAAAADDYICELIAETLMPDSVVPDKFVSPAMHNGNLLEPEIRRYYSMERNCDVQEIGGILSTCGRCWCSPDGIIGDDGGLEAKGPLPKTHVRYLLDGTLPDDYKIQVHASLLISERKYWDFISYVGTEIPPFIIRVQPDSFTEALRKCLDQFHEKYTTALARIRDLGAAKMETRCH